MGYDARILDMIDPDEKLTPLFLMAAPMRSRIPRSRSS